MADNEYAKAGELYLRVATMTEEDRDAFLDAECRDSEVRKLVESMVAAEETQLGAADVESVDALEDVELEATVIRPADNDSPNSVTQSIQRLPGAIGRYEIKGLLGEGAFGQVLLGFDSQLQRNVAIKIPRKAIRAEDLESFLLEARRVARLRHSGIVAVFDVGELDGKVIIISDYISGTTLSKWLEKNDCTWQRASEIVADLAEALSHAHAQGVIHRDMKPANVILTESGQPVILDFGLAISSDDAEQPGVVAGTPRYMSPEQVQGRGHQIDGRTDIYALGVILYQMLADRPPYTATTVTELMAKISREAPEPLGRFVDESVPAELVSICEQAMARKISQRFPTALDLAEALRNTIANRGTAEASTEPDPEAEKASESGSLSVSSRILDGERRQLTAVLCDIDDPDMDRDPEEFNEFVSQVQSAAQQILVETGGYVSQETTEGIIAWFGYPVAWEDAVFRAVHAALRLSDALRKVKSAFLKSHETVPECRIALHTGLVVTNETTNADQTVTYSIAGSVSKVATGVAATADDGTVVMSDVVHRIVGHRFETESIGNQKLRGVARPVEVFSVEAEATADLEDETRRLTPITGREYELGVLQNCWQGAQSGTGQTVLVCADAGVGKTRLIGTFREQISATESKTLIGRCSAYHENSAFYAVGGLLAGLLDHEPGSIERTVRRLEALADDLELPRQEAIPLVADVLSMGTPEGYQPFVGTPELRKQKTIETLLDLLLGISDEEPVLLLIEDLHWSDASTIELIGRLVDEVASTSTLIVLTYRPNFTPPWPMQTGISQFTLGHLKPDETRRIAEFISGKPIPDEVSAHIVDRTDGVPLFVEELTKAVLESGVLEDAGDTYRLAGPLNSLSIPNTLQDSLITRLDRLGQAKDVAQLASVIGRHFTWKLLRAVSPFEEDVLREDLKQLIDSELVFQRGRFPNARFLFKHALVQDISYESMLRKDRQDWHGRIADTLLSDFEETAQSEPELIARHFTEAGRHAEAIDWWSKAGVKAQEQCANTEAVSHFEQAIALIEKLDEPLPAPAEFQLRMAYGVALIATRGYAYDGVGPVFERARELSGGFGPGERFHTLWGIWGWSLNREDFTLCRQLVKDAFAMEDALADDGLRMEAYFMPALTGFFLGEFEPALEAGLKGIPLYHEERCRAHGKHTGQNAGVTIRCYIAMNQCMLGYLDQARDSADQAVALARELNDPFSLAFALHHAGWIAQYRGEGERCVAISDEELQVATEHAFLFWIAEGKVNRGFGQYLLGNLDEAETNAREGIGILDMAGLPLARYQFHVMLARIALARDDVAAARESIAEAFRLSDELESRFMVGEIHRVHGDILLAGPESDPVTARGEYETSLSFAREQNSKLWELRTLNSLVELQRDGEAFRSQLQTCLDWFTEAQSTPDVLKAKSLLA